MSKPRPRIPLPPRRLAAILVASCLALLQGCAQPVTKETPDAQIARAEASFATGDYPEAGELARGLLARGAAPDEIRGRALAVLGEVLFFNSRVRMVGERDTEETKAERRQALEQAANALHDAAEIPSPAATEAHIYLAQALRLLGRSAQAQQALERYREQVPPEARSARGAHEIECADFWRDHVGVPIAHPPTNQDVTLPKRLPDDPQPEYTLAARKARLTGTIAVQVMIDDRGEVVCVTPVVGLPLGLTESALDTFHDWRFEPALENGEPVPVFYDLTVTFNLQ